MQRLQVNNKNGKYFYYLSQCYISELNSSVIKNYSQKRREEGYTLVNLILKALSMLGCAKTKFYHELDPE